MAQHLPDSTNEAILSLILSIKTWYISSNVSNEVDFGDNSIMFQLLKDPNTIQQVHLMTGLYRSYLSYGIPDIQGLSIIDAHATQAHSIWRIAHTPIPSFGSKRK